MSSIKTATENYDQLERQQTALKWWIDNGINKSLAFVHVLKALNLITLHQHVDFKNKILIYTR